MQITATDADEPNHPNSQIAFRILSQEPSYPEAFAIEAATGRVTTSMFQLDREVNHFSCHGPFRPPQTMGLLGPRLVIFWMCLPMSPSLEGKT